MGGPTNTWSPNCPCWDMDRRGCVSMIAGTRACTKNCRITSAQETARTGYYTMVRPKLEYPLAVTQFTQSECNPITSPVICACLSKMAYNCNSPKEVLVYSLSKLFGFGMHDYYIEQGIRQLTALVGHICQDSETGQLMRIITVVPRSSRHRETPAWQTT
jgi:hypothetical protein